LRHLSKSHHLLPIRMGRKALCRHPIRPRNRQTPSHRRTASHPSNPQWPSPARNRVSNYGNRAAIRRDLDVCNSPAKPPALPEGIEAVLQLRE
jgi:hypothetical protein